MSVPSWFTEIHGDPTVDAPRQAMMDMFNGIFDIAKTNRLDDLNEWLARVDTKRMSVVAMVALLRYSFSYRANLSNWLDLFSRTRIECQKRNVDTGLILRGLNDD